MGVRIVNQNFPSSIRIVEVGPRDGLQNEPFSVSTTAKRELIRRLFASGLTHIEGGSFVSPRWIPQMADTDLVLQRRKAGDDGNDADLIIVPENFTLGALVPNDAGLARAEHSIVNEIAIFIAASESFSQKNTHCSIQEGVSRAIAVTLRAKKIGYRVRGYISCAIACPFDGPTAPSVVVQLAKELISHGCDEVVLSDTIGTGTPRQVVDLLVALITKNIPLTMIAVHFHDTYGMALANCYAALHAGVSVIDSSIAGLGGCPYAPGASGNLATEDLVYMACGLGIATGIDMQKLLLATTYISSIIGRAPRSRAAAAILGKQAQ